MTDRPALALINCSDSDLPPARPEEIAFARNLARARARAMMAGILNDSAPRK